MPTKTQISLVVENDYHSQQATPIRGFATEAAAHAWLRANGFAQEITWASGHTSTSAWEWFKHGLDGSYSVVQVPFED